MSEKERGLYMFYKDMREFIKALEDEHELLHVTEETNWDEEIGAVSRRLCDLEAKGEKAPALMFDNITDYPGKSFFCNSLGSYRRYALALGLPKDTRPLDIIRIFHERIRKPIKPVVVSRTEAPCKENIYTGDEIDLIKMFPTPKWHDKDGGRYIGTFHTVIMKSLENPEWTNWGLYRVMIHDRNTTGFFLQMGQHNGEIWRKYKEEGKVLPVCMAIGQDPVNTIVSCAGFPAEVSEVDMAGALRQAPVELVKAETCDLMVPAHAEIILEGYVDPNAELKMEGPFGEFTGYYGGAQMPREVFHVTCITTRNNPILLGSQEGVPLTDDNICGSIASAALSRQVLMDTLKVPGVKDVFYHPFAASWGLCVISCKRLLASLPQQCANAIWGSKVAQNSGFAGWVIVVEEDVDPSDFNMVLWSMTTRCDPKDRIYIAKSKGCYNPLWPNIPKYERTVEQKAAGAVVIDAGFPHDWRIAHQENIPDTCDWNSWPENVRNRALEILNKNGMEA